MGGVERRRYITLGAFLGRHGTEDGLERGIVRPGRNEDAEHGQLAAGGAMDEVTLEVKSLSRQQMLARMVKMILQQLVLLAADHAMRARLDIDLNGVAVVEDAKSPRLVGDIDRLAELGRDRILEVDRRLLDPELARLEVGRQLAPTARSRLALIAPMRRTGRGGGMAVAGCRRHGADRRRANGASGGDAGAEREECRSPGPVGRSIGGMMGHLGPLTTAAKG